MRNGAIEQAKISSLHWYRGAVSPGKTTPLELVMIQATPFCNIDCKYCYLGNRSDASRLALHLIESLFGKLISSGLLGDTLGVSWHAGEPLVLPVNYYEAAFAHVARAVENRCRVTHCFQTNATRVTQDYCDLIRRHAIQVGVSIDGPDYLHDRMRKTRSGRGTHAQVVKGIELLRANGIEFSAIAVLTRESLKFPNEIFDYFNNMGVTEVGFNVEELEGANHITSLDGNNIAKEFKSFLYQILARYVAANGKLKIREFTQGFAMLGGGLLHQSWPSMEANPLSIISMDVSGRVFTFSPELLDAAHNGQEFDIGHINDIEFTDLYSNPRFLKVATPVAQGVEMCRAECGYFDLCGGGAPANKLAENGSFASTATIFCQLRKQCLIDVLETFAVDRIQAVRRRRDLITNSRSGHVIQDLRHISTAKSCALKGDIRLQGRAADPNCITLFNGAQLGAAAATEDQPYEIGAYVPRLPERRLSSAEITELCMPSSISRALDFVCIVRTPWPSVRVLSDHVQEMINNGLLDRHDELLQTLTAACGLELSSIFSSKPEDVKILGVNVGKPNLTTTTLNRESGRYLGLHLDSWSRLPANGRSSAPNRLCINLGKQSRKLLFINKNIDTICKILESNSIDTMRTDKIAQDFIRLLPEHPVLSVEIRPEEGYIAPTENMIHDGMTIGMTTPDVSLTLLGRFDRAPPEALTFGR